MRYDWIMGAFELRDMMNSFINTGWVKPMNTRTRKTVLKERRRAANLPRAARRRLAR